MKKQMKNMPAGQEDAEAEQTAPKAGDILNEQDAFLLKNSRNIIEGLGRHLIEERRLKEQALLESDRHKQRADDMAEEAKQAHEDARRKDEIINRKDEEISRMRAESERKDAAHAEEISRMRAENLAIRKAAVTYLHETSTARNGKNTSAPHAIPEILNTPKARFLLGKLREGQILDEHWQPLGLSNAERGIVAQYISGQLGIAAQWQTFGSLWNMKPETLRRAAAKALDQRKTLDFQELLKGLLRA